MDLKGKFLHISTPYQHTLKSFHATGFFVYPPENVRKSGQKEISHMKWVKLFIPF